MKKKIIYSLPQYGLGSWLQDNAGTVGTIAGAGLGMLVGNPALGATIGGTIGNGIMDRQSKAALELEQNRQTGINNALANYAVQPNPMYGANFANGGKLARQLNTADSIITSNPYLGKTTTINRPFKTSKIDTNKMTVKELKDMVSYLASKRVGLTTDYTGELQKNLLDENSNTISAYNELLKNKFKVNGSPVDVDAISYKNGGMLNSLACGGKMYGCGGKMKTNGGMLEATKNLDNVTVYGEGGTHQQNPVGGVKLGRRGLVEQGEVRFKDYIFSNKF